MATLWSAPKDPHEKKDYVFRFYRSGETVSAVLACEVEVGTVEILGAPAIIDDPEGKGELTAVKVRLSGGVVSERCEVRCLVEHPSGQTSDLTGLLRIKEK